MNRLIALQDNRRAGLVVESSLVMSEGVGSNPSGYLFFLPPEKNINKKYYAELRRKPLHIVK